MALSMSLASGVFHCLPKYCGLQQVVLRSVGAAGSAKSNTVTSMGTRTGSSPRSRSRIVPRCRPAAAPRGTDTVNQNCVFTPGSPTAMGSGMSRSG